MKPGKAEEYPAPREVPLSYPGTRPTYSYLLSKGLVLPLLLPSTPGRLLDSRIMTSTEKVDNHLGDFLEKSTSQDFRVRYAILGYGSNPVPGQLVSKFGTNAIVPVIRGRLLDCELVYNLISNQGYAYAELLIGERDVNAYIAITFLDEDQLGTMKETEQHYRLAELPRPVWLESGDVIGAGSGTPVYFFAGLRRIWVPKPFGEPMAISELVSEGRRRPSLTQAEALRQVITDFQLQEFGIRTIAELVSTIRKEASHTELPNKIKTIIQKRVDDDPRSVSAVATTVGLLSDKNLLQPAFG